MSEQFGEMIDSPLVLVSNRQPYRHEFAGGEEGQEIVVDRPGGGVVAGLDAVARELGGTWIAWGDGAADAVVADDDGRIAVPPEEESYTLDRVWLDTADVAGYYEGYANRVLWPICHTATGAFTYDPSDWECYRDVNAQFADEVIESASADSIIWFQDYHLALAPRHVREAIDATLAHFWHIPWPPKGVFDICPQRVELLDGLLANDVIGFHIEEYCEHFLDAVEAHVPDANVDRESGVVYRDGRTIEVAAIPLGVDVDEIRETATAAIDTDRWIREEYPIRGELVLGVDRLDYTKGIPHRLDALEYLWEGRPELRGTFTYVHKAIPTREGIVEYQELQEAVDRRIERINARFGTGNWQPVVPIREFLPKENLYGLYRAADVLVVTALRDGMNLVAQEYVAATLERDGVLVLSEFAGAHEYLGEDALTVNPYDSAAVARAIEDAVDMETLERHRRMKDLVASVEELDIEGWIASMLDVATTDRAPAERPARTAE